MIPDGKIETINSLDSKTTEIQDAPLESFAHTSCNTRLEVIEKIGKISVIEFHCKLCGMRLVQKDYWHITTKFKQNHFVFYQNDQLFHFCPQSEVGGFRKDISHTFHDGSIIYVHSSRKNNVNLNELDLFVKSADETDVLLIMDNGLKGYSMLGEISLANSRLLTSIFNAGIHKKSAILVDPFGVAIKIKPFVFRNRTVNGKTYEKLPSFAEIPFELDNILF